MTSMAYDKCIPIGASLEITLECNLRCRHCYNFDRSRPPASSPDELTTSEILRVIDELADAGCLNLSFTGGEPLMHPDIGVLIRHARKGRFAVKVKTNGTLLAGDGARRLAEAGAFGADITLWGGTAGTHDALTGVPGSHEAAVAGIRSAMDEGLDAAISFCFLRDNAHEAARVLSFAEELGIACRVTPQVTARYDGTRDGAEWRVDRETLDTLYRGPLRHLVPPPVEDASVQCCCARSTCAVSANGDVYPCIGAPIASGNIRNAGFAEIWRESPELNRIRSLTLDDFTTCKPCPLRPVCRRNSGVVFTNTGNYTGAEEWTCMEAEVIRRIHLDEAANPESATPSKTGE
jgi:radical SAM protein with 4Fe4S-binding SPASM domain